MRKNQTGDRRPETGDKGARGQEDEGRVETRNARGVRPYNAGARTVVPHGNTTASSSS